MQSKHAILVISFSVILTGVAFSQCTQPETTNGSSDTYSNENFVVDTTMQDSSGTQGRDTTMMPQDTSSQDTTSQDTTSQDGDTTSDTDTSSNGTDPNDTAMNNSQNGDGSVNKTPPFDPGTIDSFPGKILSIDTGNSMDGKSELLLSMKTKDEDSVKVFLAPASYLKNLNLTLKNGDSLTVVGSKVTDSEKKTAIVASQVIKSGATYLLRDDKGVPFWPKDEE